MCVILQFTISNRAELRKPNSCICFSDVFVCMLSELRTDICVTCINLLSRVHKQTPFIIFTQDKKKYDMYLTLQYNKPVTNEWFKMLGEGSGALL